MDEIKKLNSKIFVNFAYIFVVKDFVFLKKKLQTNLNLNIKNDIKYQCITSVFRICDKNGKSLRYLMNIIIKNDKDEFITTPNELFECQLDDINTLCKFTSCFYSVFDIQNCYILLINDKMNMTKLNKEIELWKKQILT